MALYSAGHIVQVSDIVRVKVWHNIDPCIVAGFYKVRVPGIVRVNFRDTYPHYIGPPTVPGSWCQFHTTQVTMSWRTHIASRMVSDDFPFLARIEYERSCCD